MGRVICHTSSAHVHIQSFWCMGNVWCSTFMQPKIPSFFPLNPIQVILLSGLLSLPAEKEHRDYPWMQIFSSRKSNWSVSFLWLELMWILEWLPLSFMSRCFALHVPGIPNLTGPMARDSKLVVCHTIFSKAFYLKGWQRGVWGNSLDVQDQTNYRVNSYKRYAFLWSLKL